MKKRQQLSEYTRKVLVRRLNTAQAKAAEAELLQGDGQAAQEYLEEASRIEQRLASAGHRIAE